VFYKIRNDDDETHNLDRDTITTDLTAPAELYDKAMLCTFSVEEVCLSEAFVRLQSKVNGKKETGWAHSDIMVTLSGDGGYPVKVFQSRANRKLEIASSFST